MCCDTTEAKLVTELTAKQLTQIIANAVSKRYDSIRAEVDPDGKVRIHLIYNTNP
jgi:hypothetical protein